MNWSVDQILKATGGRLLYGPLNQQFSAVGIDSRNIDDTALFVAIVGETHDGHSFVQQVVESGIRGVVIREDAKAALGHDQWEKMGVVCVVVPDTTLALGALASFQRCLKRIPVVAITGSNGKTSTRRMAAHVMGQRYLTLATAGNFNNEIGLPLTLFGLTDAHEAAVLELGMNHPGEIDRLGRIARPTIGVVTNVGPAHLEFLGSLDGVARAKGELLAHIDASGWAVLNKDDERVAAMARQCPCKVVFFGTSSGAQVRAEAVEVSSSGISFDLILPNDRAAITLRAPGRFMVSNALAAAAAGHAAGLTAADIKAGLEQFRPEGGRLDLVKTANGVTIIDDTYNANPASMAAAIETFEALCRGRSAYIVLGDMLELGDQAQDLHAQVGRLAAGAHIVKLYAYGNFSTAVLSGAGSGGMAQNDMFAGSKADIAADLIRRLEPGDWLLVKGSRGMAMETVVAAVRQWGDGGTR